MKKVCENELHGICGQGSYPAVIEYFESCEDGAEWLAKYEELFADGNYVLTTGDGEIDSVLRRYEDYLKYVLVNNKTTDEYKRYMTDWFKDDFPNVADFDEFEKVFQAFFTERGLFANFGVTPPFPTLYLWRKQTKHEIDVELPETSVQMNVYEMDGIVTRGWYDYLTFGVVGAGGWVSDDGCYYFAEKYDTDSEDFKVSLLKHEGQHFHDQEINYAMPSHELEYRAKLVELIYLQEQNVFNSFLLNMSDDISNPHAHANKRIVTALSKMIFGEELVTDKERWTAEYKKVSDMALQLFKEDTATSKWLRKRVLIWRGKLRRKLVQWWKNR